MTRKHMLIISTPEQLLIGKKPVLPLGTDRFTLQSSIYSLAQKAVVATAEEVSVVMCIC